LKFCSLTWDHVQVTVDDRLNYIELLSASQCDPENVQTPEGTSCIIQRVLLTLDCDLPVLKHFSKTSDPQLTPWDLSNRRSNLL
jgi:hypothetical protein